MEIFKLSSFTKGWIVGDFEPSLIKTKDFEVAVKKYQAGDSDPAHTHKVAEEITVIVDGEYKMNNQIVKAGDVIRLKPGEVAEFTCLRAGHNVVIKVPSVKRDKLIV